MKPSEATVLIATIARTDRRTVGETEARSWAELMTEADVPLGDAVEAVKHHFGTSREYLMPIHIIDRVKEVRRERLARAGTPPIPGDLSWAQERDWRILWCANVKDGMTPDAAALAASEAMNLPKELPPAPDAVAEERKALIKKLAESKATPKPKPENFKPKKPRDRWGCWWRGSWAQDADGNDIRLYGTGGDRVFHEGGPYGIEIRALVGDPEFWIHHIAGKGWAGPPVLSQLVAAWADLADANEDQIARAIVWVSEAIEQERDDPTAGHPADTP